MDEVGAKSPSDSVQQTSKSNLAAAPKSAEKGGTLDAEAIRISNTFLHQGNAGELLESAKVEKVPTKGILKKTTPKESTPIETVIPQKKEETKRANIPTKDDVVHEPKNTLANQANKVKLVNEPKNEKQDTFVEKEKNRDVDKIFCLRSSNLGWVGHLPSHRTCRSQTQPGGRFSTGQTQADDP